MSVQSPRVEDEVLRLRAEYLEMPGLRLTAAQAQRLTGIAVSRCEALLAALVDAKFLHRTRDGSFVRAGTGRAAV